jgi:hypothetical protein
LRPRQWLSRGDQDLRPHEVNADHLLRDGMLDLQARIHLEEIETRGLAAPVEKEFDRSRVAIARGARDGHGGVTHPLP